MYELAAPYLSDPTDPSWQEPMRGFLSKNKLARQSLKDLKIDAETRGLLNTVLSLNIAYMEKCLKTKSVSYKDLKDFAVKFKPLAPKVIWVAANTQVTHWMGVLDGWKKMLGDDWDKLIAAANTIYVARQNNILYSVLVQYMGKDAIHKRLLLLETTDFITTRELMHTSLTRIMADRAMGAVYYDDYYLMDFELLGGGGRKAIEQQCEKRNMTPELPPLVPFNSTEWPWRIDPKSGTGPATLEGTN